MHPQSQMSEVHGKQNFQVFIRFNILYESHCTLRSSSEREKSSIEKRPQDQLIDDTTTVAKTSAKHVIIIPDTEPKSSDKVFLPHTPSGNSHATAIVGDPVESVIGETHQPNEDGHSFRTTPYYIKIIFNF